MYGRTVRKPQDYDSDDVKLWFHRIGRGIARRKEEYERWDRNEQFENLEMYDKFDGTGDQICINKVGSWINTRLANTLYRNPRAVVRPIKDRDYRPRKITVMDPNTGQATIEEVPQYRVVENILNYIVARPSFGLNRTLRRFAKSGYLAYGAVKLGYEPTFSDIKSDEDVLIPIDKRTGMPDFSSFVTDENGELVLEDGKPIKRELSTEKWFCDWTSYRHLIIDPDGGNEFYDHAWVAQEVIRSLEDVKADRNLKNTKDLEATGATEESDDDDTPDLNADSMDETIREDNECVRLFEIYDFNTKELIVLADGYGKFLRKEPIPLGVGHSPFVFFRPQETLGEFYPRPRVSDLVPINDEYNRARQQWMVAARRVARKYVYDKNKFSDSEIEKIKGPEDMAFIGVENGLDATSMQVLPVPQTSPDLMNQVNLIGRDFDEVGGSAGESRGVASSKTATQVSAIQQYATAREDDDRQQLADAIREIFKKLLDSLQANLSLDMAVAIAGEDGRLFLFSADRTMIEGDFDVDVDITEMMPRNRDIEKAQFIEVLQVAAQAPWIFTKASLSGAVLDMFGIRNGAVRDAMVEAAVEQMQANQSPPPGQIGPGEGAGVPPDEATMMAQQGGEMGPMMGGM